MSMQTLKDDINWQIEYFNSEDYINNYADCINDELGYSSDSVKSVLANRLYSKDTQYDTLTDTQYDTLTDKETKYIDAILEYYDIADYCDLEISNSYWSSTNEVASFGIEEIELYFEDDTEYKALSKEEREQLEDDIDCLYCGDEYAYYIGIMRVAVILRIDELITAIDNDNEELREWAT